MGGPTGAREIGPHRGGGGKREKAISPGRGGAEEEIVNAHLSLGLEIIPIVHRNYDGWTIRWSLPARRPTWDHEFESDFLQRRVCKLSVPQCQHLGRSSAIDDTDRKDFSVRDHLASVAPRARLADGGVRGAPRGTDNPRAGDDREGEN